MKKVSLGGFVVAMLIATPVLAADMAVKAPATAPVVMPFNWTGFYVGGNAGYAWADPFITSNFSCTAVPGCPVNVPLNLLNVAVGATGPLSAKGFTGGVQAGYNWQNGSMLFGVEADINAFSVKGSRSAAIASTTSTSIFNPSTSISTDWLSTLRGRAGFVVAPAVLLYATGGLAVAKATLSNTYTTTNDPADVAAGASSTSKTLVGWTVGGGVEWALSRNWSVKGEYLYADLGSISAATAVTQVASPSPNILATSTHLRTNIARAGINYKFDWDGPVMAKY
jgi:outer membrane immunogenic protein